MDRIDGIFQDSQDSALANHPVNPEKSCSSCLFFAVRMFPDGLYTNDKFCHSRPGRLKLRPLRAFQKKLANSGQSHLPADIQRAGG
ncbi:MAG: hypothetical protein SF339_21700, partial [Blastocatellia bacterium]|nr:hypothetical protein [Blastocatellia bacterium]